jgi:hypothetical protein
VSTKQYNTIQVGGLNPLPALACKPTTRLLGDQAYSFNTVIDSDEDVGGDLFEDGDDDGTELVKIDVELRQLGSIVTP